MQILLQLLYQKKICKLKLSNLKSYFNSFNKVCCIGFSLVQFQHFFFVKRNFDKQSNPYLKTLIALRPCFFIVIFCNICLKKIIKFHSVISSLTGYFNVYKSSFFIIRSISILNINSAIFFYWKIWGKVNNLSKYSI